MTTTRGGDSSDNDAFIDVLAARASDFDDKGEIPSDVIDELGSRGFLGATVSTELGGLGFDDLAYGELCARIGGACSSTRSLVTVQNLVAHALHRWGDPDQRSHWLPKLASGEVKAAFCLTEPEVGSDGASVETSVRESDDGWVVDGTKLWVTGGRVADLFLVIGRHDDGPVAALVERNAPGISLDPVTGQLGLRAAMLADVRFADVVVPHAALLGRPGFGWSHVAATALDHGRHSVAWGCVGICRSCVEVASSYALRRRQFGKPIAQHQLVRRMIADMTTDLAAAESLCERAASRRQNRDPSAIHDTMVAKYFASRAAARAGAQAVQVLGAVGTSSRYPAERHFRDAKIMQIIEGSDQMQQLTIAEHVLRGRTGGDE